MKISTIHNPINFDPSQYEVIDYLDNKKPEYCGQPMELYREIVEAWKKEMEIIYGSDWVKKIHKCAHCGNGNVRWIACVEHISTKERVTFGSSCVNRLGFKDQKSFRLALIQSKANAYAVKIKAYHMRQRFIEQNPQLKEIIEAYNSKKIENYFIKDVIAKLNRYGSLSERQVEAVEKAYIKENMPKEPEPDRGPAPSGRQTVIGNVLAVKTYESAWGYQEKMLVELDNLSKIWVTIPRSISTDIKGKKIEITATFTVSKDDKSFAYGKRPKASLL